MGGGYTRFVLLSPLTDFALHLHYVFPSRNSTFKVKVNISEARGKSSDISEYHFTSSNCHFITLRLKGGGRGVQGSPTVPRGLQA